MTRPALILAALACAAYMLILPLFRLAPGHDQMEHTLYAVNAEPSDALLWAQTHLPASLASTLTQILVYGTHQPVMFSRFWDCVAVEPTRGAWQFSHTAGRLGNPTAYMDIRAEIHAQQSSVGLFGNVWCTAVRDSVVDWGRTGALVQFGLMGLLAGWVRKAYTVRGSLGSGLLYAVFAGWCAFSWSVSATTLSYYEMFMIGVVVLWVCGLRNLRA